MPTLFENPEYKRNLDEWVLARDLLEGRHDVLCRDPQYLWLHAIEVAQLAAKNGESVHWSRRSQRSRYFNHSEIVTSLLTSILFREQPDWSEVQAMLGDEIDDIDGEKNSLFAFIKNTFAVDYLNFGKAAILVEATRHEAKNRAEEIALGVRPFLSSVHPLAIKDWDYSGSVGNMGKFNWIRYEYTRLERRSKPSEEPTERKYSKAYLQNGAGVDVFLYKGDKLGSKGMAIAQGDNWEESAPETLRVSQIPLIVLQDVSWLRDVNQESLRFHNIRSSRDNILHNQCYQKIFITGVDANDAGQMKGISETTWPLLPVGSTVQAIEPPSLEAHEKALEESQNNIFKVGLNLLRLLPSDSRVAQGADTISEEKDNAHALIETLLTDVENAVNQALVVYAEHKGQPNFKGKITLNKEISSDDLKEFALVVNSFKDQFVKYPKLMKSITKKAAGKLNLDEKDELAGIKEIEAAPDVKPPEEKDPLDKELNQ